MVDCLRQCRLVVAKNMALITHDDIWAYRQTGMEEETYILTDIHTNRIVLYASYKHDARS